MIFEIPIKISKLTKITGALNHTYSELSVFSVFMLVIGGWRLKVGGWKLVIRGWRLEIRD